jgi:hypothetical protein
VSGERIGDGPLFRVVRGTPTPEELAALTAVLASLIVTPHSPPHAVRAAVRQEQPWRRGRVWILRTNVQHSCGARRTLLGRRSITANPRPIRR